MTQSPGLPSYNSGIQFLETRASDYNFTASITGNINSAFDFKEFQVKKLNVLSIVGTSMFEKEILP